MRQKFRFISTLIKLSTLKLAQCPDSDVTHSIYSNMHAKFAGMGPAKSCETFFLSRL
jgi:hypothetical protein